MRIARGDPRLGLRFRRGPLYFILPYRLLMGRRDRRSRQAYNAQTQQYTEGMPSATDVHVVYVQPTGEPQTWINSTQEGYVPYAQRFAYAKEERQKRRDKRLGYAIIVLFTIMTITLCLLVRILFVRMW